jgi:lysophospholipase L1-like esterase
MDAPTLCKASRGRTCAAREPRPRRRQGLLAPEKRALEILEKNWRAMPRHESRKHGRRSLITGKIMGKKKLVFAISLALNLVLLSAFLVLMDRLGGLGYVLFKATAGNGATGMSVGRAEHFRFLAPEHGAIVFLGDSLTEQAEWAELLGRADVKNRGIGGDSTEAILNRIDEAIHGQPAKVFILAGINDLVYRPKEKVPASLTQIVCAIRHRSPRTEIYVQSLLPVNNDVRKTGRSLQDIRFINEELAGLAQAGLGVVWIDLYPLMADEHGRLKAEYTYDGIHLNGDAYRVWRDAVAPFVNSPAPASTRTVATGRFCQAGG